MARDRAHPLRVEALWRNAYFRAFPPDGPTRVEELILMPVGSAMAKRNQPAVAIPVDKFVPVQKAQLFAPVGADGKVRAVIVGRFDAVTRAKDHVDLWEFRRNPQLGLIGELSRKAMMFRASPENSDVANQRLSLLVVSNQDKPLVRQAFEAAGIEFRVFLPPFLADLEVALAARKYAMIRVASRRRRALDLQGSDLDVPPHPPRPRIPRGPRTAFISPEMLREES